MHGSVVLWGEQMVKDHDLAELSVLDVGSQNVNGSFRVLFNGLYLGIDLGKGDGVDMEWDMEQGPLVCDPTVGVVVCTEVLEHVRHPTWLLRHARQSVTEGSRLLLTARGYDERGCFIIHEHPIDVWRFSAIAMETLCEDTGWRVDSIEADPEFPGWFVLGTAV
jgi:hypothetical protein